MPKFFSLKLGLALLNLLAAPVAAQTPLDWSTYGFDVQRHGFNPNEYMLNANTVSRLHELWTFNLNAVTASQPIYASGVNIKGILTDVIYIGSENGNFYAINAITGQQIWSKNLGSEQTQCLNYPKGLFGVSSTAALDRANNRIYVVGGTGYAYALDLSSGATASGWPVKLFDDPTKEYVWSAVNFYNGKLYATSASYCDFRPYHGRAFEVDTTIPKLIAQFIPTGANGPDGGGIWGYGGVSIAPLSNPPGNVFLAVGNAFANPESYGYAEHVVRLSSSLQVLDSNYPGLTGEDTDLGTTPVLFQPTSCPKSLLAAEDKFGALLIYDRNNLNAGPLQKIQIANSTAEAFIGLPAFSPVTNRLYVTVPTDSDSGVYKHGLVSLKLQTQGDCTLTLDQQTTVGYTAKYAIYTSPTVANNIVYFGDGKGSHLYAVDAKTGQLLWTSSTITNGVYAPPIVIKGHVYVGAWDNKLHAFGL